MCGFFPLYVNLREKDLKEFTQLIMHCLNFVGTQLIGAYFILKDLKDEPLTGLYWAKKRYQLHLYIPSFLGKAEYFPRTRGGSGVRDFWCGVV